MTLIKQVIGKLIKDMQNKQQNKRVTLIKRVIGKPKTAGYPLPENKIYGIPSKKESVGAGVVVSSWAEANSNFKKSQIIDFPSSNTKALQHGCLTSKAQREYGLTKPVMKNLSKPPSKDSSNQNSIVYNQDTVFGIKNPENDVPIKALLKCPDFEESDYPDLSNRLRKGRLPPSKKTKASKLFEQSIRQGKIDLSKHPKEAFKMKKFLKVDSKVKKMMCF